MEVGMFEGLFPRSGDLLVSHLQFADDTIIFCHNSQHQIRMLRCVLRCFEVVLGLHLNLAKSSLIAVGAVLNLEQLAADLGCRTASLPFAYLGMPLGSNFKKKKVRDLVIDRMRKRLAGWKARYLSKGGRVTQIKASLASIPIYYLSLFVMPSSVCKVLEQIQRDFLWRRNKEVGGLHLVAWDRVCTPKERGEIGIRRLQDMNQALLYKWLWRFGENKGCLWRSVVVARHGVRDVWTLSVSRGSYGCSPWRGIWNYLPMFFHCLAFEVENGTRIRF